MPWPFPTPPLELLAADGRVTPLTPGAGRPRLLLARELCSFERFEPPAGGGAGDAAARLYARTHAPFHNPGNLVRRDGAGYAIWWWDLDRVGPQLAARFGQALPTLAPETLAQPPGEGWRVVRLASGFELQCWRARALVASAWRPAAPDDAAWAAFARQQRGAEVPAPAEPPPAQTLPVLAGAALGPGRGWRDVSPVETLKLGLTTAAVLTALATAFWIGQALRLDQLSGELEQRAAAVRATTEAPRDDAAQRRLYAAYQALGARPDPIAGLKTAIDVLRRRHLAATGFSVDGQTVTVTLPYAALPSVAAITLELQATGAFADVRPLPDSAGKAIELQMTLAGR